MSIEDNLSIARRWIDAFNRGDVEALVSLYAEDAVHTSPKLRAREPETEGKIRGRKALFQWWTSALAATPSLRYEPLTFTASEERVVIEYLRHADGQPVLAVSETFDVRERAIVASRVYHG
ncbi:MAG: nuclear transport factor 2 family protein [Myxococcales bacterium]|nr:nuclear transport factor 2 family protein [Myxococcales bacterium]